MASSREPALLEVLELRSLDVPQGGGQRLDVRVPIAPLVLGGQTYTSDPAAPPVRLDASRAVGAAWYFRLRGGTSVTGPCWRCLEDARVGVTVDTTEISDPQSDDPQMQSLYVVGGRLMVAEWARDSVAEALPPTILCRDDCAGLCPTCGADLNLGPCGCPAPAVDTRWSALAELAERLKAERDE